MFSLKTHRKSLMLGLLFRQIYKGDLGLISLRGKYFEDV
jgi:hypothetical protein